jgi:hypothetical protein
VLSYQVILLAIYYFEVDNKNVDNVEKLSTQDVEKSELCQASIGVVLSSYIAAI